MPHARTADGAVNSAPAAGGALHVAVRLAAD